MKKSFKTFAVLFAAATITTFVASCAKDELSKESQQLFQSVKRSIDASANLPQPTEKAYIDEADDCKVKWEITDSLNINGSILHLTKIAPEDSTKARFEGTINALSDRNNDEYWTLYPTYLAPRDNGNGVPAEFTAGANYQILINIPTSQTYNSSEPLFFQGKTYMAAHTVVQAGSDKLFIQMCNIGAIMKLHLEADPGATNTKVKQIVFSTTSDRALAGKFYLEIPHEIYMKSYSDDKSKANKSADGPYLNLNPPSTGSSSVLTVDVTDGIHPYIDIASGADVCVWLPPVKGRLTMVLVNTDDDYTLKSIASATINKNNIYTSTVRNICFCDPQGDFSVSTTKRVVFAPGNLQWSATGGGTIPTSHSVSNGGTDEGTWRFAEHQWDYVGDATHGTVYGVGGDLTVKCDNSNIGYNYQGWIDLFGWATSGWHSSSDINNVYYLPYSTETRSSDIPPNKQNYTGYGPSITTSYQNLIGSYRLYDWGVYNAIYNPKTNTTDAPGTWRTLNREEYIYLLATRPTVSGLRYAKANVNGINGLLILPDSWFTSFYTLNNTNKRNADYTSNVISISDWNNILEPAGCVFLPTTGYRHDRGYVVPLIMKDIDDCGISGFYWTSTGGTVSRERYNSSVNYYPNYYYYSNSDAYMLPVVGSSYYWNGGSEYTTRTIDKNLGCPVRLVKDVN